MDPLVFFFAYIVPLFALVVIGGLIYAFFRRPNLSALDLQVLSIKIPRRNPTEGGPKDSLAEINQTEQLFNSLSSMKKPFVFEVAVENGSEHIHFYLAVPRAQLDFAKRQVQGLFLEAEVNEAPEYNIFSPNGESAGGYLSLAQSPLLPLRTYREAETDTFAPILSTLSKLKEQGDGAVIQLLVKPATEGIRNHIGHQLERLKKGEKSKEVLSRPSGVAEVGQILFGSTESPADSAAPKLIDEEAVKALTQKIGKPLYAINLRLIASSADPGRAEEIFSSLSGAFSQFTATLRNSFKIVVPKKMRRLYFEYSFREWNAREQLILNAEELASVFHLPTASSDVPRVAWLRTREVPPPADLPTEGVILGENVFRGDRKLVRLLDQDRFRHLYVVGQTGVGKSYKLFTPMITQDIAAGKGVCVIDPHGDLVDNVLDRIPPERADDVIVFDPGDLRRPLALNMLEYDPARPEEKSFIVGEILKIFDRLYDMKTAGGPMFEYYLRNALLLLLGDVAYEPATLLDVPRIFSDADYRNAKLSRCADPLVVDFWTKEANKATGDQGLGNMTVYIVSKFASFISNDYLRPIIGQAKSAFNVRELMDSGKILLVKLAKGKLGEQNANLLGMIITGRILMAALGRGDRQPEDRRDFFFYIDEFQNFTTDSISTILSEARKYRLSLTVAHQFIAQLKDDIREAVFGNVGSMIAFRVGASDTEYLLKHFGPEFNEKDLTSVENDHAFARLLVRGEPARPFSFTCLSPAPGSAELREKLAELSRLRYGRDLAEIEREIVGRLRPAVSGNVVNSQ